MDDPVAITRTDLSGLTWLALDGELDTACAALIGGRLTAICDASPHVVLDTRGLGFVDLAGARLVAGLQRRQRDRGARLSLVAGDALRRLVRLGGMTALFREEDPEVLLGLAVAEAPSWRPPRPPAVRRRARPG